MEIVIHPNPILREKTTPVVNFDLELKNTIEEMIELLHEKQGVGLAAPQVGLNHSLFIADVNLHQSEKFEDKNFQIFINPRITWSGSEKMMEYEGCLSIPNLEGKVARVKKVRLKAQDLEGNKFTIKAEDWLARVLQHETDHLSGILYLDYIKNKNDIREVK